MLTSSFALARAHTRTRYSMPTPRARAAVALLGALLWSVAAAEGPGGDVTFGVQADGSVRRANPAVLRQLTGLAEDNRRLRLELENATMLFQAEAAATHELRLAAAREEAAAAAARVKVAELELETATQHAAAEAAAVRRAELDAAAAASNATAAKTAADAARVALEEGHVRERLAAAESERARAEAAKEESQAKLRTEEVKLVEIQSFQLSALRDAAVANASRAAAEASRAASEARMAEDKLKTAEAAAREAEASALTAAITQRLTLRRQADAADGGGSAASEGAPGDVTLFAERGSVSARAAAAAERASKLAVDLSHASSAARSADSLAAHQRSSLEALTQALQQGQEALRTARDNDREREEASLRRTELEVRSLELQLRIAEEGAKAAGARREYASTELRKAEAAQHAAEAQLASQREAARQAGEDAARAQAMADAAAASSKAAAQRLAAAEAEAASRRIVAEAAEVSLKDIQARARTLELEASAAETARQTAALNAAAADARAVSSKAEADTAAARAKAAFAELEQTREARVAAEANERAAVSRAQTAESSKQQAEADAKSWAAKRDIADAQLKSARVALNTTHAQISVLELQHKVALVEAAAASDAKIASIALASTEASKAVVAEEQRLTAEAQVQLAVQNASLLQAEVAVAEAKVRAEESAKARELAVTAAQLEAKKWELEAHDMLTRERDDRRLQAEEESALRREAGRRDTELAIAKARAETELAAAEARARIEGETRLKDVRDNEDVHARAAAAAADALKQRWLTTVTTVFDRLGQGAHALVINYLERTLLAIVAMALGIYASKELTTFLRLELQRRAGVPPLVRDTSVPSGVAAMVARAADGITCGAFSASCRMLRFVGCLLDAALQRFRLRATTVQTRQDLFHDVILSPDVEKRVQMLAASTSSAHAHAAPLRHALFYGPPGTGKSMVATRLAKMCGLDYAILAGGDVAPLGDKAVTELHRLFDWANASPRGLLLFIDEADAFLGVRNRTHDNSRSGTTGEAGTSHALSALLARTGGMSKHGMSKPSHGEVESRVMLVLATNRPEDLDDAVLDRIDEMIFMGPPDTRSLLRLGRLYFYRAVAERSQYAVSLRGRGHHTSLFVASEEQPLPEMSSHSGNTTTRYDTSSQWLILLNAILDSFPSLVQRYRPPPAVIHIDSSVTCEELDRLSSTCHGFSGRQMAKLMSSVQASIYAQHASVPGMRSELDAASASVRAASSSGSVRPQLTLELLREAVSQYIVARQEQAAFATKHDVKENVADESEESADTASRADVYPQNRQADSTTSDPSSKGLGAYGLRMPPTDDSERDKQTGLIAHVHSSGRLDLHSPRVPHSRHSLATSTCAKTELSPAW